MKYVLKVLCVAILTATALLWVLLKLLFYWVLYPTYALHRPQQKPGWLAEEYRDWLEEIREFWQEAPIFYPGWREGLSRAEQARKIDHHTASWFAYCKEQNSYNPN